jgi:DMSO/TMAO reductase YedYZ molybdopterin-dependent catalytic subunit
MRRSPRSRSNTDEPRSVIGRREFIAGLGGLTLVGNPSVRIVESLAQELPTFSPNTPYSRAYNFASLRDWITPNAQFFVRGHFPVPQIPSGPWILEIGGDVEKPLSISVDDLMKLNQGEQAVTLECAGNGVGMGMVSNARWVGASLGALLRKTRPKPNAREVVLIGSDGGEDIEQRGGVVESYSRSIPIDRALDGSALLAYRMNGELLPRIHGGPLRALLPGWYGMDSVKWLRRIVITGEPFSGFYQTRRYYEARRGAGGVLRSPLGLIKVKSQIARPVRGEVLHVEPVTLNGAAWGGIEVSSVEVSCDGGRTWAKARLGADRERFAWRLWSLTWAPPSVGRYEVLVRARDVAGNSQPLDKDSLIVTPYANNTVERRTYDVR